MSPTINTSLAVKVKVHTIVTIFEIKKLLACSLLNASAVLFIHHVIRVTKKENMKKFIMIASSH